MDTTEAQQMAWNLMAEFLPNSTWQFKWDRSVSRFGCCKWKSYTISLSKPMTELNSAEEVEDVIRHELAHALAGSNAKHGPAWKIQCRVTGARPTRCYDGRVTTPPKPWLGVCSGCGAEFPRHRVPRGTAYHCYDSKVIWTRQGVAA